MCDTYLDSPHGKWQVKRKDTRLSFVSGKIKLPFSFLPFPPHFWIVRSTVQEERLCSRVRMQGGNVLLSCSPHVLFQEFLCWAGSGGATAATLLLYLGFGLWKLQPAEAGRAWAETHGFQGLVKDMCCLGGVKSLFSLLQHSKRIVWI